MKIQANAELRDANTMAVPSRAAVLVDVEHWHELPAALNAPEVGDLPALILGGGSNVLFHQAQFEGAVIRVSNWGKQLVSDNGEEVILRVAAGENWHRLVRYAAERGWWGIENLALIPGRVGAAPVQNIGAYGVELSDTFDSLKAYDRHERRWVQMDASDCAFAYRDSVFKQESPDRFVITEITLRLSGKPAPRLDYAGVAEALDGQVLTPSNIASAIAEIRQSKLPDPETIPNAGSFFKNPIVSRGLADKLLSAHPEAPHWPVDDFVKLSAAWLIEQCGLKGYREGDAAVYDKHALVLVNHGAARGEDIWALAQKIQHDVRQQFGINLEPEPRII